MPSTKLAHARKKKLRRAALAPQIAPVLASTCFNSKKRARSWSELDYLSLVSDGRLWRRIRSIRHRLAVDIGEVRNEPLRRRRNADLCMARRVSLSSRCSPRKDTHPLLDLKMPLLLLSVDLVRLALEQVLFWRGFVDVPTLKSLALRRSTSNWYHQV